ncbi:MAG: CSLREA domain-containing protein, partial [Chloroflexi bacterium]|nr:CSLREA domain-containing protein [Chloroflexota bacterium]
MFTGSMIRKLAVLVLALLGGFAGRLEQPVQSAETQSAGEIFVITSAERGVGQGETPRVWLEAPATAVAGQPLAVKLMVENVAGLAGFEAAVKYDSTQLGLRTAVPHPALAGERPLLNLGVVPQTDRLVVGAVSCPTADCAAAVQSPLRQSLAGGSGRLELAELAFDVRSGGPITLDLADILLVDVNGRVLLASDHYQAEAASNPMPELPALDLSGNHIINDADAYLAVDVWRDLARNGRCLHPNIARYDVNASGCLTTADIQTILAAWGQATAVLPAISDDLQSPQATFTVNSAQDQSDMNHGDGLCLTSTGTCTLRAAIEEANARTGADTIAFNIRNTNGSCPDLVTITPGSSLTIDAYDNASLTIDGYTQCNAAPNSAWITGNAVIKIEIRGSNAAFEFGLHVLSPNNVIQGLAIYNWHRQIQVLGDRAYNNTIAGNFLGTNAANTFIQSASGLEGEGLRIQLGAHGNLVGGATPAARNIISGNDQDGLDLEAANANIVHNNYIGLKQSGAAALMNIADGVDVAEGAANNWIGGLNPGERNVISGNGRDGIEISHDVGTQGNQFAGNFVGLAPNGLAAIPNRDRGVTFEDVVNQNDVYRNVIAGNGGDGVRLYTVFNNRLTDNFIGVAPTSLGSLDVVPQPGT